MTLTSQPLVSIVTPVYNEENHLAECVESVLAQTYPNWEYTIINNCSTDRSLEIARRYTLTDSRIKIHNNTQFLDISANHNLALRQISPKSKYCKMVQGDDWLFPECLEKMVAVAEANPSAGLVSAYQLYGDEVRATGLPYHKTLVSGPEACRQFLMGRLNVFGTQSSVLYRADLVRSRHPFYLETDICCPDWEACLALLRTSDLGFVHQVLTFTRPQLGSFGAISWDMGASFGSRLNMLLAYGRDCLSEDEFGTCLEHHLSEYYRFLGRRVWVDNNRAFLSYHKNVLNAAGVGFSRGRLARAAFRQFAASLLNPKHTWQRLARLSTFKKIRSQEMRKSIFESGLAHRKKRVYLFGNFGSDNLGNEATLAVTLYHLRRLAPDAEVSCICTFPDTVARDHTIPTAPIEALIPKHRSSYNPALRAAHTLFIKIPCELYCWAKCIVMLSRADALIIPGTGLLTDAFGLTQWGPYRVFQWSMAARLSGCRLAFVSVGTGPLYSRLGRFFVKSALALADFRSYRDQPSLECLKSIGPIGSNSRVYPDLVFSLPMANIHRDTVRSERRTVVGVGLMGDAGRLSKEKPDPSIYRQYLDSMVVFVSWLLTHGYDVRLLIGDVKDKTLIQQFRQSLNGQASTPECGQVFDVPAASVEQLISQVADVDLVVATRFHNVLLALLLNKPAISISFHHKCTALMGQMGLGEYYQEICDLQPERLIEQFRQLEKNAESLKQMISERVADCREALDEQYSLIFQDVLQGYEPVHTPAHGKRGR